MKFLYKSPIEEMELSNQSINYIIPCNGKKVFIIIEQNEEAFKIFFRDSELNEIEVNHLKNQDIDITRGGCVKLEQSGKTFLYQIDTKFKTIADEYATDYEYFYDGYQKCKENVISGIENGKLQLYAIEKISIIQNYQNILNKILSAYTAFRIICEKPKSHLRAENEVRPIETVKRVGYEAISYLASHSEDWLARTVTGLKPARLFSRIEEEELQIYENRVVRTLLDHVIAVVAKIEKKLRDQHDQIKVIMNENNNLSFFGVDRIFRKALKALMKIDEEQDKKLNDVSSSAIKQKEKAKHLIQKFRLLRDTKMYRQLRKAKPVANPLNMTNILTMDKNYAAILELWKYIHCYNAKEKIEEKFAISFDDSYKNYQCYCYTLCCYTAHMLGFQKVNNVFKRETDALELDISMDEESCSICIKLSDKSPRCMPITSDVELPIEIGQQQFGFIFDGINLSWASDISEEDIDNFCKLFKSKHSRGKEQKQKKDKYLTLKQKLEKRNREYGKINETSILIFPVLVMLDGETQHAFKIAISRAINALSLSNDYSRIIVALPLCTGAEQEIIDYAKNSYDKISIIPLSLYDINSFRRIQNIIYRMILTVGRDENCPNCGNKMRKQNNQYICEKCKLTLTKTSCSYSDCQKEFRYIGYEISTDMLTEMQKIKPDDFYLWDSLFQYKDVVNMKIEEGRIKPVCPYCGR